MDSYERAQYVNRIILQFQKGHATFLNDPRYPIRYSIMEEHEIDEAAAMMAKSFIEQNEMYKTRGITVDDYLESVIHECRMSVEDKLSIIARDMETNQIIGVAVAYSYNKALQSFAENEETTQPKEALAPVMDCMLRLVEKVEQMESFNPDKTVIIDDVAAVRGEKYTGKLVGFLCAGLVKALCVRLGYSYLLTVVLNPVMQRRVRSLGYKLLHSLKLDEYIYRGEKVFSNLVEKGYHSGQIFVNYLNDNCKKLVSSPQAKL
ncbi:uncharacterized protein TRIADDRAFT_61576 [Trichoplax adhaerens]|uniref:N-acetyltransferase domain-containing protein n=1 Tax=Trichoplax adhaerens TaxID=10228 RepID=B3SBD5_TRIAD|nr:hypothetical protein TRIADDRAFT_61576 [Trichoplax adhaerens]EDV19987.1 hypothetical protein TRIADDRAFT_61576 [Trichoplax adhaerens]|eukprot:XP_002117577.1 hypothetical protein TRIADDRAFT_61576 [Trichoplax adhaerens]